MSSFSTFGRSFANNNNNNNNNSSSRLPSSSIFGSFGSNNGFGSTQAQQAQHAAGRSRIAQLEMECALPALRANAATQRNLFLELQRIGNDAAIISRFEFMPQLPAASSSYPEETRAADARAVQLDPEILRIYISALSRSMPPELAAARIASVITAQSGRGASALPAPPTQTQTQSPSDPDLDSMSGVSGLVSEGREHTVRTSLAEWERALGSKLPVYPQQQKSSFSSAASNRRQTGYSLSSSSQSTRKSDSLPPYPDGQPIQVIISEAWSWSKFSRKLGSRLVYGILIMTGLSVVLDQQGIIKSGMGSNEVEPTSITQNIKFADVQGVDEAKQELEEVVQFLREPSRFMELGGKLPKGILLYGPPGTGKTHLARAVAGEAGVPFFQMSGSEFDELYVGVGARRVRELFAAAKKRAPCIIFIDELDAVGSKRSMKDQSYMRQTLNQLLVELDGFAAAEAQGVVLIAATNTPDSLDKALIRPGRFDRLVPVPLPDVKGRTQILKVHMKGVQLAPTVKPDIIARGTPGFSGADLANLVNQAAIKASKDNSKFVSMADLEWAKDKIIMGSEKKSAVITEENKRLTAYHEGGHTLVALYTPGAMPLHKVTVIPRGNALGVTVQLPEADKTNHTKRELLAMLDVCMGGRVAEELIFGPDEVTTGASSDLQKATSVAREMVMSYGMSEKVGLQSLDDDAFERASSQTRSTIESEVKELLEHSYARTFALLKSHKDELHKLAKALIDYETLSQEEVRIAIKGGDLSTKKD
eukprot:jgi/Hompol1/2710/HPOL_003015-RA